MKTILLTTLMYFGTQCSVWAGKTPWCKIKIYENAWTEPLQLLQIRNDTLYASGYRYVESDGEYLLRKQVFLFPVSEIQSIIPLPADPFPSIIKVIHNVASYRAMISNYMTHWIRGKRVYPIGGKVENLYGWL